MEDKVGSGSSLALWNLPVTFLGPLYGEPLTTNNAYIHLLLHSETPNNILMFNRYISLSFTSAVITAILFSNTNWKFLFNMPPKPKLNVQSFPRPPLLERTPRHLQVKWRGQTIADTKEAFWVLETYHPPSKCIPLFQPLQIHSKIHD